MSKKEWTKPQLIKRQVSKPQVVDGWLVVDGCKVAKAEPGGVLAFHDKDCRRSSALGGDQRRVDVHSLVQVIEQAEAGQDAPVET